MKTIDYKEWWAKLAEPFDGEDYEWRLAQCGKSASGTFWAICLCYVTNRAIMNRLDSVCSPANWKNEFSKAPEGGVMCGISIRVDKEWIIKYDAAENTAVEAIKGGISDSMKRCAVQWGIGRLLYNLKEGFAVICEKGKPGAMKGKTKAGDVFYWLPPQLPDWAMKKKGNPSVVTEDEAPEVPEPRKTYKNFEFLKEMAILKAILGDKKYKEKLKVHGYDHSNEIPPKSQAAALKAFNSLVDSIEGKGT